MTFNVINKLLILGSSQSPIYELKASIRTKASKLGLTIGSARAAHDWLDFLLSAWDLCYSFKLFGLVGLTVDFEDWKIVGLHFQMFECIFFRILLHIQLTCSFQACIYFVLYFTIVVIQVSCNSPFYKSFCPPNFSLSFSPFLLKHSCKPKNQKPHNIFCRSRPMSRCQLVCKSIT